MLKSFFITALFMLFFNCSFSEDLTVYVSTKGADNASGNRIDAPLKSIAAALEFIKYNRSNASDTGRILLLPGAYYLENTITIRPAYGPLSIEPQDPGSVIVKGSKILDGEWVVHRDDIVKLKTDMQISPYAQLYIEGVEQILARYPNYDSSASHYHGYAADAIDPERVAKWKRPEGAIIHGMHSGEWGGFHYEIDQVSTKGKVELIGGHQNNRPSPMHKEYRMVENVFEELDAPGEWYFDNATSTLFLYPFVGTDLSNAKIEVTILKHLIELKGNTEKPISNISIQGIRFEHTNRTFMEDYEPLLRSDWMIYRGAAIYLEQTENCTIEDCELINLGGNAIFASGYNRDLTIEGNHIYKCGASAVSFVGLPSAVRSPSFTYNEFVEFEDLDLKEGPKSKDYPSKCFVDNNLIHDIGLVEKQVAGVQLSMSMDITVRHNSIYDVPRSGINVSEGTWGGHIIEFNDVFNTVLETSDHGAFNSWGRDRFWHPNRKTMDQIMEEHPQIPYLDAIHTTLIRNNRMRCDHGWDIDLDDGSSNYHLYNNLCLNGGIKLREGFYRTVENNIMVNNGFHPHVWFKNSGDIFQRNIMMTDYKDIRLLGWGQEVDYNLFPDKASLKKAQQNGTDFHSSFGDPLFTDPVHGNFMVLENSTALDIGFINFTMDQFGVQKPALKKLAKTPEIPKLVFPSGSAHAIKTTEWLGANLKNIETIGERSAAGLNETSGVLITSINKRSLAERGGLHEGDVIIQCEEKKIKNITGLLSAVQGNNWKGVLNIKVIRNQVDKDISVKTR